MAKSSATIYKCDNCGEVLMAPASGFAFTSGYVVGGLDGPSMVGSAGIECCYCRDCLAKLLTGNPKAKPAAAAPKAKPAAAAPKPKKPASDYDDPPRYSDRNESYGQGYGGGSRASGRPMITCAAPLGAVAPLAQSTTWSS